MFQALFDAAHSLRETASNEGCDTDLMVVGAKEFHALLQTVHQLKKAQEAQIDANRMCDRLLDSEEHAGEAAVPEVAEDAADLIRSMATKLGLMQTNLTTATGFVTEVANLSIWSYDNNEGESYEECDEPGEGFLDSHCCLMALIEQARKLSKQG